MSSDGVSPRVILAFSPTEDVQFNAQVAKGFRLGGINDPLNVGLCSAADRRDLWRPPGRSKDEKTTNYEIGTKTRFAGGRVTFNAAVFFTDIEDLQVIADAGSCSSRIVLNAEARERRARRWSCSCDPTRTGTSASRRPMPRRKSPKTIYRGKPVAGVRDGNRLPTAPELQASATAAYNWNLTESLDSYMRFTLQHVGSSFTQLADQEAGFGVIPILRSAARRERRASSTWVDVNVTHIDFDAELPSYDIGNLRWGFGTDAWEAALFVNNLWDERAFLSIDRERGRSARVGYLTNPPRTYGVNFHMNF